METRDQVVATSEPQEPSQAPACPVCGGQLTEARSLWRCVRCSYTLCEGCEGGSSD